jgi:hypothetical protein
VYRVHRKEYPQVELKLLAHQILLANARRNAPLPRIEEVFSFSLIVSR